MSQIATIILSLCLVSPLAHSQELDKASHEALQQTQDLLNNHADRQKAVGADANSKAANSYVSKVSGGDQKSTDDIYKLASDVFANVVKEANGDPKKMQEAMDAYANDPTAFAAKFSPEQQQRLHEIGARMPATPTAH